MITMRITHDGKEYDNIIDASLAAIKASIQKQLEEKLIPIEDEINKESGVIKVDIGDKITVTTSGFSDVLDQKIMEILSR